MSERDGDSIEEMYDFKFVKYGTLRWFEHVMKRHKKGWLYEENVWENASGEDHLEMDQSSSWGFEWESWEVRNGRCWEVVPEVQSKENL